MAFGAALELFAAVHLSITSVIDRPKSPWQMDIHRKGTTERSVGMYSPNIMSEDRRCYRCSTYSLSTIHRDCSSEVVKLVMACTRAAEQRESEFNAQTPRQHSMDIRFRSENLSTVLARATAMGMS
eukprot:gnl/TRDRNA2_/TRDRNA2_76811_c0_seq1.p1 gnl/TRDRNA2_/TRDRNA2_76811_c0~~gnl/TRDRNA2_/TRDRNA2_76811_c0_seq1.p1  ORF type:complete len:126 (+),score=7.26 gnl/TRDRNA2_/TRDRNA2_76811_c0_seq1:118-495(+)